MTLHRFFVEPGEMAGDRFAVPRGIERQVRAVLRLRDADRLVLLPGDGTEAVCRLDGPDCVVEGRRATAGEPGHRLVIVQALLKGDGLETVVREATEVGAAEVRLVVTERCVVRGLPPRRIERLRAVARESAEQSERGIVPPVTEPRPLSAALGELPPASVLLYERHRGAGLGSVAPPPAIVIGPEGGFSRAEVDAATTAGLAVVGLGPRILRSQTVAGVATAVVLSRTGDLG